MGRCLMQMITYPLYANGSTTTERVVMKTKDDEDVTMWFTTTGRGWKLHMTCASAQLARQFERFCNLPYGTGAEINTELPAFGSTLKSWLTNRLVVPQLQDLTEKVTSSTACGCGEHRKPHPCQLCSQCILNGVEGLGDCPICMEAMTTVTAASTQCCGQCAHAVCLSRVDRCCFCRHEPLLITS